MASLGQYDGRFRAGGAATCHEDVLLYLCRGNLYFIFSYRPWIQRALSMAAAVYLGRTALKACHALDDVFKATAERFFRHMRIRQGSAPHIACICLAASDNSLRYQRIVDTPHRGHRNLYHLFDLRRVIRNPAMPHH